jgi:hypothetical protein
MRFLLGQEKMIIRQSFAAALKRATCHTEKSFLARNKLQRLPVFPLIEVMQNEHLITAQCCTEEKSWRHR